MAVIFLLNKRTCSEAHKRASQEHMNFVVRGRQVDIGIVDISRNVDEYRADKRLPPRPVIGP